MVVAASHTAAAGPCEELAIGMVLLESRTMIDPSPDDTLGVDVVARTFGLTLGRCEGIRHHVQATSIESPDLGDPDSRFAHFGRYQLQWHADNWSAYAGVRALTLWGKQPRIATPVIGFRAWPGHDMSLTFELESAGVFVAAISDDDKETGSTPRQLRRDVAFDAAAVWPTTAATRGELRVRLRDYRIDEMRSVRDVTATAGVGFALAARRGMRGMPGFLGVAVRHDEDTRVLLVVELALGVLSY